MNISILCNNTYAEECLISTLRIPTGESLFEKVVPEPVQQTMTSQSCDCSKADLAAACPTVITPGPPMQVWIFGFPDIGY